MTQRLRLAADPSDESGIRELVRHLERGGAVAYPTETVYGIGARADNQGVRSIHTLKGRQEQSPFLLLVPGEAAVTELRWTADARRLAEAFWPGPLTLVLEDPSTRFPPGIRSASGGVGVRRSPHPWVGAFMQEWAQPLISTSANRSGFPPASEASQAEENFRGVPGAEVLALVDGGSIPPSVPSTVLDLTGGRPRLLREGAVPRDAIEEVVGQVEPG